MSDETSGIIGWPIGQQYRERAARDEASSTTTWETIVQNYKTRAVRDGARIDELRQSTEHWHDTAQMLMLELLESVVEQERDGWKARAMQSEVERQALTTTNTNLRAQLILAEWQRDQAKADAEHWKCEWAVAMGQLGGARAEVEALRKYLLDLLAVVHRDGGHHTEAVGTRQSVVDAELAFYALRRRAEAAEAKLRDVAYWHEAWKEAEAERDALRKAVDAVRATRTEPQTRTGDNDDWVDGFQYGYAAALETVNDALDAALALQPTTSTEIHA